MIILHDLHDHHDLGLTLFNTRVVAYSVAYVIFWLSFCHLESSFLVCDVHLHKVHFKFIYQGHEVKVTQGRGQSSKKAKREKRGWWCFWLKAILFSFLPEVEWLDV